MQLRRLLLLSTILALGLCPLWAVSPNFTITYSLNGILDTNLNGGPDCLMYLNTPLKLLATIDSTISPTSITAATATYTLSPGAISGVINGMGFTNRASWNLRYALAGNKNELTLSGPGPFGSLAIVSGLVGGSFPITVLGLTGHPAPLTKAHQPQDLTPPSSYLNYSTSPAGTCMITKLGFTGTIGSVPANPIAPK